MIHSYIGTSFIKGFLLNLLNAKRFTDEYTTVDAIRQYFLSTNNHFQSDISSILDDFNDTDKDLIKNVLFNELTTGRGDNKTEFGISTPFEYLQRRDIYSRLKKPLGSFFIGEDVAYPIADYQRHNPYLFFNLNNMAEKYFLINTEKRLLLSTYENPAGEDFLQSWNKLKKYKHNFFDIIISDRYCLSHKYGMLNNIPKLIKSLSYNERSIRNITFCIEKTQTFDTLDKTYNFLKNTFYKWSKPNIKIIAGEKRQVPHDRFIITNSFFLKSGHSFHYFKRGGTPRQDTSLNINSISKRQPDVTEVIKAIKEMYSSRDTRIIGNSSEVNLLDFLIDTISSPR